MSKVKNAQAGMLTEDDFLTIEEQDRLLDFWEGQAALGRAKGRKGEIKKYLAIHFLLRSGLRASEAVNVKIFDLRLKGETPHILVRNGKGAKSRKVYIGQKLTEHLKAEIADREEENYLLVGKGPDAGKKPILRQALGYTWGSALDKAGVRHVKLHGSRHSFGYRVYRETQDLRLVQKQLGHSKVTTTTIYADLNGRDISEKMKEL